MSDKPLEIDITALVEPISDLLPSGESLRRGTVYDKIREARREDDPRLAQGIWKTDVKRADWREVEKVAIEALQSKSKDLRVAAWLMEAWLHQHGFPGAERGLRVVEGLCDRFWDTLYPQVDEDDLEARMAPLSWINDKLSAALKQVPMTAPATKEPDILTWDDWEKANMLERAGQKPGEGEVSTPQFQTAVLLTPARYYKQMSADIHDLKQAAEELERLIDKKVGQPMATLWQFKETLTTMGAFVGTSLDQKAEEEPGGGDEAEGLPGVSSVLDALPRDEPGGKGVRWGPIRNRAEAYQRLAEAADYLIQKEPHSPVPHLIRRAVSWGNMTFAELIQELVHEQHNLGAIYSLLGMKAPD